MERAVNPQTGEVVFLVNNQWVKPTQIAQNPKTGEMAYLVGNQWQVLPGMKPQAAEAEPIVSPEEMLTPIAESPEIQALREKTKEYEAGTGMLERAGRDIKRGVLRGLNVLPSLTAASRQKEIEKIRRGEAGRTDPLTGEFIPLSPEEEEAAIQVLQQAQVEDLESAAKREAEARAIPSRPVTQAIGKAKTFGEAIEAAATDPIGAMAGFSLESLPQMAPALAIGAVTRQPIAGAAAMGGTSLASELGNSVFEYLAEQGVDVNDTNAVMSALDDPKLFKEAYDFALKRGAIIGTIDAATAGLASKALVPKRLIGSPKAREAVNIAIAQPAAQIVSGAGGEAAAQLATYGEIRKPGEIVAEALGEGPTSLAETAAFGGRRIYEELRAKEAEAAPKERVEPEIKEEAPKPPAAEPTPPAEPAEGVAPAFEEAEIEAVAPEVPADKAEISRLEAELAKVQRQQFDPTIEAGDPRLDELQRQESDIKAKLAEARGEIPTEDLYDRLIKATPQELKKIEIPTAEAPDLYLRASEDENASPALVKRLTKIVNEMEPEDFPEPKVAVETPKEEPIKAGKLTPPPSVEVIMENFGVGRAPAEKYLTNYKKFYDIYNRFHAGEETAQEYTDALIEKNKAYQRIINISRQNKKRAEAKPPEAPAVEPTPVEAKPTEQPSEEETVLEVKQNKQKNYDVQLTTVKVDDKPVYGVRVFNTDTKDLVYESYFDEKEEAINYRKSWLAAPTKEEKAAINRQRQAEKRGAAEAKKVKPTVKVEEVPAAEAKKEEHVEAGEAEPITKPVIQQAVNKGAVKKDIDYTAMKREVERQVNEAISKSPFETEKDWDATYSSRQNFVTFEIPGDGKFKVKNNKERLEEFKKRLMSSVKPKESRGPQFAIAPADVNTTLRDLVDSNDIQSAIEFAALKGVKISESKLDLKQKLKVKEYMEDPDAFERKVAAEAELTEAQRQAMAAAEEKRRIETNKRLAEEQEKRERDWINARYDDLIIGSSRTVKNILDKLSKDDANKILDKIDISEDKPSQEIIEALQKIAGTYVETRWKEFVNKIDSPLEIARVTKKLFEKFSTKDGMISLHQLVEKEVDGGSTIFVMDSGERRLGDAAGYLSEKKIGTVGMDYAGYLIAQKKRTKADKAKKLTDEQIDNAQTHAQETGGEVVFQKGDYALIRGYSVMTGDPVYVPTFKTQRGRVDVESFTGTQVPSEIKQEMIMFKRRAERDAEEKHKTNPFIKFDRGLAMSSDIPENLAGVIRGWKDLLKLDVPVYVSTIQDAKKNRNNFTGPHRRVGSGTLDENERGSVRRMADGSYYILFDQSVSPTFMLEVIAHEMGHLHERLVYERATSEQKAALQKAHQDWLSRQKGKMAKDLVEALRGRATGRRVKAAEDKTAEQLSSYWKSFGEWYADQVSRWAVTGKAPVTIVEKFFKRLANQLRNFYQKLVNAKYLPDETFVEYIEEVTQKPANLAPANTVINDTPELMKDVDTDETRQIDELLAKYDRPQAPLHPSDSVKDRMIGAYRSGKDLRKRIEDEGLLGLGKGVISGADRAITYARNKNVWYGTGLDQADFSRYNGEIRDSQSKAVASIAVTNAIHAGHVGTQVMVQGKLEFNKDAQQFKAAKSDKSMANVLKEKAKLIEKLGDQRAANVIQAYFEAKRSRSIVNEFLEREQRYQDAIDAGVDAEDAAVDLANIERAMSKVNMDDEQIDEFIALEREYPELRAMMDNWTAVNQNMLDMLYFAGNLSKTRYEQLKSIKDYVPWYRIVEDQTDPHDVPTGGTTKTMTNVAREKRFKAGEVGLDIDDIVDNMIHNVMWMTKNAMRNYAANRVADQYGIRNEKGRLKVFPKEGTDSQGVKFNILRNGRRIVVGVEDPLIAESVIGMENVEIPMNSILSIMANGLRRSITLSGAFQLKQLFMDAPTAAWVSGVKNPFAVWGNTFIAFGKVLVNKDPIAQRLREAGIGGFQSTARTPEKELALEIGLLNKSNYARVLRVLDHIGDASDYAQRVAVYKQVLKETKDKDYQRLLKQGKTEAEAREMARGDEAQALLQANNVIDFLKRGSGQTAQFLSRTVAFMNAYAQSVDVLATTLAGGSLKGMERKKAFTRMAITGTLLSFVTLMYCFAVGDDEEYDKLDDKTKLRNFIIPGSKKYFGETIALPMHTSASFFFKAIPELLYNRYIKDGANNKTDSRRYQHGLWEAFKDAMLGPNVVPTGAKPFIEIGLNKNFWAGTTVIPKGMEDLVAAEQYNAATSELGKIVSALTSIPGTDDKRILAPIEADHLMRGLFGSAAAMAMWGTNMLAGDRAESRVKDLPVIGSFVLPPIPRGREELFYDLKGVTDEKYKTYMSLLNREKYDEADKYLEKNSGLIALHDYTTQMESALKEINAEIRRIGTTSAKDMSPKERREQMNEFGALKGEILEGIESLRKEAFD